MMHATPITSDSTTADVAEATLFLPQVQRDALPRLLGAIDAALRADAVGFRRIAAQAGTFTALERDGRRIVVALCPEPVDTTDLMPHAPDRASVARLRDHCACVSISVRPRMAGATGNAADRTDADRICAEIVARVLPLCGADLVHWIGSGRLQRAEELVPGGVVAALRRPTTRTPRPVLAVLSAPAVTPDSIGHPVSRIGRSAGSVPRPRRPSELRTGVQPPATTSPLPPDLIRARGRAQAEAVFPPLAPADGDGSEEDLKRTRFAIYGDGGPQFGDRDAPAVQRLSVYALNMSLIVAAAPVGAAVLVANMIFGENMRLTSHALALTGLSVGTDLPERALALLAPLL